MAEDPHYYTRNIEVEHLVSKDKQKALLYKRGKKLSKIIKASQVDINENKVCIIGGEGDLSEQDAAPAIVIEKDGDRISKITVTCPCGRHSELVCEYEDENGDMEE